MARLTPEQREMLKHIRAVMGYLTKKRDEQVSSLESGKPFANWTLERTQEYARREIEEYNAAIATLFVESMRIDPD